MCLSKDSARNCAEQLGGVTEANAAVGNGRAAETRPPRGIGELRRRGKGRSGRACPKKCSETAALRRGERGRKQRKCPHPKGTGKRREAAEAAWSVLLPTPSVPASGRAAPREDGRRARPRQGPRRHEVRAAHAPRSRISAMRRNSAIMFIT